MPQSKDYSKSIKKAVIGKARDLNDKSTFSKISLVAFFAWVGLGSDPLSSSCYGPEEIYRHLSGHTNLALIVSLLTVATIFIISTSYMQIIKLFPNGGGGYLVASRLISPTVGMVSGSALLIDYVLTISISLSSGADALFSFLPINFLGFKLSFTFLVLGILIVLNLRGVKESVYALTPIFVIFVLTHIFLIAYVFTSHASEVSTVVSKTGSEFSNSVSELGIFGTLFLIMRAYSMGAGTYTGIEAVSNGLPNLREPRVPTAIKTMRLLTISLSIAVLGLIVSYFLMDVKMEAGKTLNAVLIQQVAMGWNKYFGYIFIFITLFSEAAILFVAAQTGFLDGPRVMANMAQDSWFPRRFTLLSDRLVSQNGILLMGIAAFFVIWLSGGSVAFLVVLYSINVFITFSLSQYGMVKHWFQVRKTDKKWFRKLFINGIGFLLTTFILITVIVIKFDEGGWITIIITGSIVAIAISIKRHYLKIAKEIKKIQTEMNSKIAEWVDILKSKNELKNTQTEIKNTDATAVILVNGYSGIGLFSLFNILNSFHGAYKNFVFIQVGIVDSDCFHGADHLEKQKQDIEQDLNKYVYLIKQLGYNAEFRFSLGTDVAEEVEKMTPEIIKKYPNSTFIGGQLIFEGMYRVSKILHNYTIFSIQRRLYKHGLTTIIIPISLEKALNLHHN
ncbi:MAG TPA: amino acid transporter [Bacteroidales bacterium]|nr:MAG: amino acid transporter [Bacteroidetes bacterium GWF2_33_38]HBF87883.1 amino acid transporter [Bacteroidales bacterium]